MTDKYDMKYHPRNGVSFFRAGLTPGWGDYEFRLNGEVMEGVREVDTEQRYAIVYARDSRGHWPVFAQTGEALVYKHFGNWTVHDVFPPDELFDDPNVIEKRAKKNGGGNA